MSLLTITVDTEKNTIVVESSGKKIKNVREINIRMQDPNGYGSDDNDGDEEVYVNIYCREKGEDFDSTQILTLSKAGVNIIEDTPEERLMQQIKQWRKK